jgi:hypothetical protein
MKRTVCGILLVLIYVSTLNSVGLMSACARASILFASCTLTTVASTPTLSVVPGTKTVVVGDTFTVNVTLDYLADLFAFDLTLNFDNTKLNATALTYTGYLGTGNDVFTITEVNNTSGYVNVAVSRLVNSGVTGGGDLAVVRFKCIGPGTCTLHQDHTVLVVYPTGNKVAHSTVDGQVKIGAPPQYHELVITSLPMTGIPFFINSTSKTTPHSESLLEGIYTLEMPQTYNGYSWSEWLEDGYTNRTRTITMNADVTLTGVYATVPPQEVTLRIDSVPPGVTFTVDSISHSAPWSGSYSEGISVNIVMPETHTSGMTKYLWDKWNDGVTNPSRTVSMTTDISITAVFTSTPLSSLFTTKTVASRGSTMTMNFTLANYDSYPETFNVTVYANTTVIGTQTVNNVSNRTFTLLTFTWNTTGFAYGNYTLYACAASDNCTGGNVVVTIPGDIDGNFNVRLSDLVLLAQAYGSIPGDSKWNPNADTDGNNVVGLTDLVILAQHYGQHYP